MGGVAGVRIPVAKRPAAAWSVHVLAEAGADLGVASNALQISAVAPAGEYRASGVVPYLGLRLGGEWRFFPRSTVGPTLGLWTFARTDTSVNREPVRVGRIETPTNPVDPRVTFVDYTLVRGGQTDVGVGLRLGFEIGR